jgi:hypothetical protein
MIWQNCLYVEELTSDLTELPVPVIWQNCLAELSVCGQCAGDLAESPVCGGACQ